MHPELLWSLAAEHRRDLAAVGLVPSTRSVLSGRAGLASRLTLPRYRISWTRTSLAAVTGDRRDRSLVIVISATRAL